MIRPRIAIMIDCSSSINAIDRTDTLDDVVRRMEENPDAVFLVVGYTHNVFLKAWVHKPEELLTLDSYFVNAMGGTDTAKAIRAILDEPLQPDVIYHYSDSFAPLDKVTYDRLSLSRIPIVQVDTGDPDPWARPLLDYLKTENILITEEQADELLKRKREGL